MPPRRLTGGQALVAQLEAIGVEVVFGIPGVHNLAIFDALRDSAIRTIVVRHEGAAAGAADGYARATGRLGVCVTTTGPGAANTAAAMGEALASRSPVLQVSTQIESRLLGGRGGRWSLHEAPHQAEMMEAASVWSAGVAAAEAVPGMVVRGAEEAFGGRRGPAFLEVPHDFLSQTIAARPLARRRLTEPAPPEEWAIDAAVEALAKARRPVLWAGGGAIAAGAGDAVAAVAERLGAPVVTTYAGKGIVPPDHPLALGLPPHQPEATALIEEADAILLVGTDLDAMNTQGWRLRLPRPRVAVNAVGQDARRNYPCDVVVEADARLALEALAGALAPGEGDGAARVRRARRAAERALRGDRDFAAPFAFVERFESSVPAGAAVVADMAVAGYWLGAYYRPPAPRSFLYPLGWGTLGFGVPAGLGVAAAGRRAVVVAGDAGFLYAAGELATVAQEGLPLTVCVFNDEGYGMLRFDQDARFGRRFAVDLKAPDFVALARSFGLKARRVALADLESGLGWACRGDAPALLEIEARFPPPLTTSPRWPLADRPEARRTPRDRARRAPAPERKPRASGARKPARKPARRSRASGSRASGSRTSARSPKRSGS